MGDVESNGISKTWCNILDWIESKGKKKGDSSEKITHYSSIYLYIDILMYSILRYKKKQKLKRKKLKRKKKYKMKILEKFSLLCMSRVVKRLKNSGESM